MKSSSSVSSEEYIPSDIDSENEEASSADEDLGDANTSAQEVVEDANSNEPFDYTTLAASLIISNNNNFQLSKEKESLIAGSTVNTVRYSKSKAGIENRFFDTIAPLGGDDMKPLLDFVEVKRIKER
jgi:hypothetical protein